MSDEDQHKLDFQKLTAEELKEQIKLLQAARARRRIFFCLFFVWLQLQSFFSGVKMVVFEFSSASPMPLQAALMGVTIAIINAGASLL